MNYASGTQEKFSMTMPVNRNTLKVSFSFKWHFDVTPQRYIRKAQ
jgi:hypothetical protein